MIIKMKHKRWLGKAGLGAINQKIIFYVFSTQSWKCKMKQVKKKKKYSVHS